MNGIDLDKIAALMASAAEKIRQGPTPEELARMKASARYSIETDGRTFLENWPSALRALSMQTRSFQLSEETRQALIDAFYDREGDFLPPEREADMSRILGELSAALDECVRDFPDGAFVKLGNRSPKDSWDGMVDGFRVTSGEQALKMFLTSMERIYEDLRVATLADYLPTIQVRRWIDIPAWAEFRCMVKDRTPIGLSQYDYTEGAEYPEITGQAEAIQDALLAYLDTKVIPAMHLDDVVVDVAFEHGDLARPILIEINPFGGLTNPCLYRNCNPMAGSGRDPLRLFRYIGDGEDYAFARRMVHDGLAASQFEGPLSVASPAKFGI